MASKPVVQVTLEEFERLKMIENRYNLLLKQTNKNGKPDNTNSEEPIFANFVSTTT